MAAARAMAPMDERRARRLVVALTTAAFLEWTGATAIVPLLPLYLRYRGVSDSFIGVVIGAFWVAGVVTNYPLGKLSDRVGRRPVLLFGLICYGAASLAFVAPTSAAVYVVLRAVQGAGAGATVVAAAATLSESLPPDRRGWGFGALFGGQMAGMAVGPLLGSVGGPKVMTPVFVGAAVAALVACAPVLVEVSARPAMARPGASHPRLAFRELVTSRIVVGVMVAMAAVGVLTGVYEVCWGLLMSARGATSWEIGLSWTLGAIPFVAVSVPAGKLADRLDRRWLTALALLVLAVLTASYPHLGSVWLLVWVAALDGLVLALVYPAPLSLLGDGVPPDQLGRAQGMASTGEMAGVAVFGSLSGALYAVSAAVAFTTAATVILSAVGVLAVVWAPVQGRVTVPTPSRPKVVEGEALSAAGARHP